MSARFHTNLKGIPGRCDAKIQCPFGLPPEQHHETARAARAAYERSKDSQIAPPKRRKTLWKFVAVGGVLVAAYNTGHANSITAPDFAASNPTSVISDLSKRYWGGETEPIPAAPDEVGPALIDDSKIGTSSDSTTTAEVTKKEVKDAANDKLDTLKDTTKKAKETADKKGWTEKATEDANRIGGGLKDLGKSGWDKLNEVAERSTINVPDVVSGGGLGSGVDKNTQGSSDAKWQGGSLRPSAKEVTQARKDLQRIVIKSENNANYDRKAQYGRSFNAGVVGRTERRDITHGQFKNSAPQARAIGGHFTDPYTNEKVTVVRGSTTDTNVDHIVALAEVHRSGGNELSQAERNRVANDPDNLIITSASVNTSKGDKDASAWAVPSYKPAQCNFAVSVIRVKTKYNLSMDRAEHQALSNILASRCDWFVKKLSLT